MHCCILCQTLEKVDIKISESDVISSFFPLSFLPIFRSQMSTGVAASAANKASGLVQRELHKAKAIVEEEAKNVVRTSTEITRSGAYLYPLFVEKYLSLVTSDAEAIWRGQERIDVLLPTSQLSDPCEADLLPNDYAQLHRHSPHDLLHLCVLQFPHFPPELTKSLFEDLPQVALLAFVSGPLAFIAAVPAVLAESAVVIKLLSKSFVLHSIEAKVFDATLLERGHEDLVASGRSFKTSGSGVKVMGKRLIAPLNRFTTVRSPFVLSLRFSHSS